MGKQFYIDTKQVLNNAKQLDADSEHLWQKEREVLEVKNDMHLSLSNCLYIFQVKLVLDILARALHKEANLVNRYGIDLELIANTYLETEARLTGNTTKQSKYAKEISRLLKERNTSMVESDVFREDGEYGGDQGRVREIAGNDAEFKEAYEWIKKIYPGLTEEEAKAMLDYATQKGCGYVAMCNSIFQEFAGKEDEFEKIFGFPYYDENGNVNHERLFIEMYTTAYRDGINIGKDGYPQGTGPESRMDILNNYLKDKNITATSTQNVKMTPEDIEKYTRNGKYVLIGAHPDGPNGTDEEMLYNMDGSEYGPIGAHCMMVTGVTDDGKIIVSSWGREYYLEMSEMDDNETYMVIEYDY
ncbi:hypothetical protein [Butyrivibrio sp. NC2002]|uniref:hypothetical protein n=1 Tax=Butyrivibrio sp. NC2002 TaxID=1410610 RepID=UPI0005698DAB|nr:hypothetical protein [Butyrivibrio sp. NC2002]